MKHVILLVLAHILSARLTAASLGWLDSPAYSSPSNIDNKCTNDQRQGFNWNDLKAGEFSVYRQISFHGFLSSNQFNVGEMNMSHGSPDRGFQEKCITGLASSDELKTPRFGLGPSIEVSSFSITKIFVSVEFDCDLEFHYAMIDHSVCKQRAACSKGGSVIENTQCGGATSVTVLYPKQTSVSQKYREGCRFGFHSIEFDCNPATSAPWISSTSTTSVVTTTATGIGALPTSDIDEREKDHDDNDDDDDDDDDDETQGKKMKKETSTIELISRASLIPISTPNSQISSSVVVTTINKNTFYTSTTIPPPSVTTVPCPRVLPACLNTWIFSIGCKSNSDVTCFCPSSKFSSIIYSCIAAHSNSEKELRIARKYYQGICVNYISTNPSIVDASPPFIPAPFKNNTLSNGGSASIVTPSIPVTVIEIIITDSIAYTQTSVQPTSLTVPEVAFTTVTSIINNNYITDVGLVPASPRVTETKAWTTNSTAQVTSPLYPLTSEGGKTVATFCVLGAAFIFAAAIVL